MEKRQNLKKKNPTHVRVACLQSEVGAKEFFVVNIFTKMLRNLLNVLGLFLVGQNPVKFLTNSEIPRETFTDELL